MGNRFTEAEFFRLKTEALKLKSALYDRNTNLVSYHARTDELRAAFEAVRRLGVLVIDLGDLTRIESVYGWQVFDDFLRRVAEALEGLRGSVLPANAVIALDGVGAARFVAFLAADSDGREVTLPAVQAVGVAVGERLVATFSGADFRSMAPPPRFEVGCSLLADDPFYRFERLMYRAVEQARQVGLGRRQRERQRRETELRRILHEEQIDVVFQPILALDGGEVLGYEALSRSSVEGAFQDPRGMFDAAVDLGLGAELDSLCQRKALVAAGRQLRAGRKLFLNTLPSALLEPPGGAFLPVDWIRGAGLSPADVVIEITERGAQDDRARLPAKIESLRAAGFGVALDDIGTGLTGLQAISEMKPDYLKLDVSLVHDIQTNLVTQDLLRSLTRVARSIGAQVIGEGVETEQEVSTLRSCGTEFGQGFLFSRPAPGINSTP